MEQQSVVCVFTTPLDPQSDKPHFTLRFHVSAYHIPLWFKIKCQSDLVSSQRGLKSTLEDELPGLDNAQALQRTQPRCGLCICGYETVLHTPHALLCPGECAWQSRATPSRISWKRWMWQREWTVWEDQNRRKWVSARVCSCAYHGKSPEHQGAPFGSNRWADMPSNAHMQQVSNISKQFGIKLVVCAWCATKVYRPCVQVLLVSIGCNIAIHMHKYIARVPVVDVAIALEHVSARSNTTSQQCCGSYQSAAVCLSPYKDSYSLIQNIKFVCDNERRILLSRILFLATRTLEWRRTSSWSPQESTRRRSWTRRHRAGEILS